MIRLVLHEVAALVAIGLFLGALLIWCSVAADLISAAP